MLSVWLSIDSFRLAFHENACLSVWSMYVACAIYFFDRLVDESVYTGRFLLLSGGDLRTYDSRDFLA